MDSLGIYEFRTTIENYVNSIPFPAEVKRLVLAEITQGLTEQAKAEAMEELKVREAQKGESNE